jgi:putative nucleotidyltransferase with HDIG domain
LLSLKFMQTITREVRILIIGVVAAATVGLVALADQVVWRDWPQLVLFFCLLALASSVRVSDPRGRTITPSTVLTYLAIYVFNPPTVLLLVAAGRTVGYILSRGWVPWRSVFNGAQGGISAALGAYTIVILGGRPGTADDLQTYLAALVGPIVNQAANNFFVALGQSRWRGTPFLSTWMSGVRDLFWPNLLSIPTAFVLATLYVRLHYLVTLVYLGLLPFQWLILHLYIRRRQLYAQIVDGLVVAADVNFPVARGHARRVAELAIRIAREMHLSEAAVESIQFAALLHDVGMIGKDDLLDRPVLTAEEADSLREHVEVGAEIARELPRREIASAILHHHERYDGSGYPGALRGDEIPLGARIIALAEMVDSMRAGMFPFEAAASLDDIISYVNVEKGRAFDPEVADAFIRVVAAGAPSSTDTGLQDKEHVTIAHLGGMTAR